VLLQSLKHSFFVYWKPLLATWRFFSLQFRQYLTFAQPFHLCSQEQHMCNAWGVPSKCLIVTEETELWVLHWWSTTEGLRCSACRYQFFQTLLISLSPSGWLGDISWSSVLCSEMSVLFVSKPPWPAYSSWVLITLLVTGLMLFL
jgi:hypothetical protein